MPASRDRCSGAQDQGSGSGDGGGGRGWESDLVVGQWCKSRGVGG